MDAFKGQVSLGTRLILAAMVPAAVGYLTLSGPIVRVIVPHATFGGADPDLISGTLALMAIGLPAFSLYLFLTRCFQAMKDARTAFYLYVVENGVNILFAFALYSWAGVHGLAFALSIAYIIGSIVALLVLSRRVNGLNFSEIGGTFGRVIIASLAMAGAVVVTRLIVELAGSPALIELVVAVPVGVVVYIVVAQLINMRELSLVLRGPLKRFARAESSKS